MKWVKPEKNLINFVRIVNQSLIAGQASANQLTGFFISAILA